MNPMIARELMNERTRDMLAEAQQARRLRGALSVLRQQARGRSIQVPEIPDYVHELIGHDTGLQDTASHSGR